MTEKITTPAELDAPPVESVVLDLDAGPFIKEFIKAYPVRDRVRPDAPTPPAEDVEALAVQAGLQGATRAVKDAGRVTDSLTSRERWLVEASARSTAAWFAERTPQPRVTVSAEQVREAVTPHWGSVFENRFAEAAQQEVIDRVTHVLTALGIEVRDV